MNDALLAVVVEAKSALLAALDGAEAGAPSEPGDGAGVDGAPTPTGGDCTSDTPVHSEDGAESAPANRPPSAPSLPWSCYGCGSTLRTARPVWGDWTCGGCRAVVAGPAATERPWRMVQRAEVAARPAPPTTAPRRGVIVTWGSERGWIAVRDPASGEWHEIRYQDAPEVWRRALSRRNRGATGRGTP